MAKSTSNSGNRIFGRKSIKTIYTLSITAFYFGLSLLLLQSACECCIVFHHGKMKQITEVLKCFWFSKVPRGVFLLTIFIITWNNVYSLTGTGGIWYNFFNSFLSSLLLLVYQVIKGTKIFNSDFVVFKKLSKKTFKFFIYFIVIGNAVDRLLSKATFLEAVNYYFCRYISPSNL